METTRQKSRVLNGTWGDNGIAYDYGKNDVVTLPSFPRRRSLTLSRRLLITSASLPSAGLKGIHDFNQGDRVVEARPVIEYYEVSKHSHGEEITETYWHSFSRWVGFVLSNARETRIVPSRHFNPCQSKRAPEEG